MLKDWCLAHCYQGGFTQKLVGTLGEVPGILWESRRKECGARGVKDTMQKSTESTNLGS